MTNPDDKLLDDFLAGDSEISKQYQKDTIDDVPKIIDETILSNARFSVRAKSKDSKIKKVIKKWQLPVSVAAVVMISVSLVITLYDEYGQGYLDSPSLQSTPNLELNEDSFEAVPEQELPAAAPVEEPSADVIFYDDTEPSAYGRSAAPKASKKQQIEQLKKDVEELKQTQSTLMEERKALERELDANENKKNELQRSIEPSSDQGSNTQSIEAQISKN